MIIKAIDAQKDIPTINILTAMKLLVLSREDVTESTVQNGISVEERDRAQNDLDDPFSEQQISAHTSASHK